jgi:hypothetical protein
MTITVTAMRSNKLVNMDIEQLRGWATFMDKAVVVSLVVAVTGVAALATTTFLSIRIGGAVRAREHADFLGYRADMAKHAVELEREVSTARERMAELEQQVSGARGRTRELEQAAAAADARASQAARESATASEKARSAEIDAGEVRKRVAELAKAVNEAKARAPEPIPAAAAEAPPPREQAATESAPDSGAASREAALSPPSPIVASLKKYAGTRAAVYVLDEARDAPAVGAAISGYLGDAGWAPLTWTWTGVSGILGVVVLIKDGSDPATNEAASALAEGLRSAGFNAAKGDWPADWRRYRGTLNGPQSPAPTEAPIRIVIGAKAR